MNHRLVLGVTVRDLSDQLNRADDIESRLLYIEKALPGSQPDWSLNRLGDNRYPMLWESVRTTRPGSTRTALAGIGAVWGFPCGLRA